MGLKFQAGSSEIVSFTGLAKQKSGNGVFETLKLPPFRPRARRRHQHQGTGGVGRFEPISPNHKLIAFILSVEATHKDSSCFIFAESEGRPENL